jgi:uncharacterized protein YbjT (DUF2867 family)
MPGVRSSSLLVRGRVAFLLLSALFAQVQLARAEATKGRVLVVGGRGFIGHQLIPRLLEQGHEVVASGRNAASVSRSLGDLASHPRLSVVALDLERPESVEAAISGSYRAAFYLAHSMEGPSARGFAAREHQAALNFANAAKGRIDHVLYLGGIQPPVAANHNSAHLSSRHEVGATLRQQLGRDSVTELQAGLVVGRGTAVLKMIDAALRRLPVIVLPRHLAQAKSQPIAAETMIDYLAVALDKSSIRGGVYEVGGSATPTNLELIRAYRDAAGLRTPVLSFRLPKSLEKGADRVIGAIAESRWAARVLGLDAGLMGPLLKSVLLGDLLLNPDRSISAALPEVVQVSLERSLEHARPEKRPDLVRRMIDAATALKQRLPIRRK